MELALLPSTLGACLTSGSLDSTDATYPQSYIYYTPGPRPLGHAVWYPRLGPVCQNGCAPVQYGGLNPHPHPNYTLVLISSTPDVQSGIHGWGLFAKMAMPQDSMVAEYRGEALRRVVADR